MENTKFFGNWGDEADVARDFSDDSVLDFDIIAAWYSYENYEGSSYVLARKDGILYENEAGHCSCNGLEGSWGPGAVTIEYLVQRLATGGVPYEVEKAVRRFVESQQ